MPFVKGHTISTGRPPGSKNKRTQEFLDVLESRNFNVAEALIWCFEEAVKQYKSDREKEDSGRISPMESNAAKYLKIASDNVKEIASYSCPKLKAIEVSKGSSFGEMPIPQQLIAAQQLVTHLQGKLLDDKIRDGSSD